MTHHGFVRALTMIGVLTGVLCLPLACKTTPPANDPECGLVTPTLYCCAIGVNGVLMSRCSAVNGEPEQPELDRSFEPPKT